MVPIITNIGKRKVTIFKIYPEKFLFLHLIAPNIAVKRFNKKRINVYIV